MTAVLGFMNSMGSAAGRAFFISWAWAL